MPPVSRLKKTPVPTPGQTAVPAAKAKTHLLSLLNTVEHDRVSFTLTKHGRPVARIVPIESSPKTVFDSVYGRMAGTVTITGDIVSPDWESWGPEWQ